MSKALIIKGADFSENKVETIAMNAVPCTGVAISPSTISFDEIGSTVSISVTLTPANTTDEVTYTVSDTDVCTLLNGVVTSVGVGSATITATCGEQTATCTVVVNNIEYDNLDWNVGLPSEYSTGGLTMGIIDTSAGIVIFAGAEIAVSSTKGEVWADGLTVSAIRIPANCDTIRITMDSFIGNSLRLMWFNSKNKPYTQFAASIEYLGASSFQEISAVGNNFTIPEGADSFLPFVVTNDSRAKKTDTSDVAAAANIVIKALET